MGLPNVSVRKPVFTIMLFSGILILGLISLTRLQIELYQGSTRGIISIITRVRGGLSPVEVEKSITKPIEESVSTVSHLKTLYSNSREGESRVTMEFEPGTDMKFAALEVREKFSRAKARLPEEVEKPIIANYSEAESAIFIASVTSPTKTPEELREIVDNQLKPLLTRVNGVASVDVYGGRERKILVELDRDKMFAYEISIEKVMEIINTSNLDLLAGTMERGQTLLSIRTLGGFRSVEEIGELGVKVTREGSIIPLKEIATIKDSYLEPQDYSRLNLDQNVSLQIKKVSDANTIACAKEVRAVLDYFRDQNPEDIRIVNVTDKAKSIERAIQDVLMALYLGVFLTTAIIYLFLKRLNLAFLIFISIPTSVIGTFIAMEFFKISINVMTLTGLALSIGMLVDNSIVVIENIFKKFQEGTPAPQVVVAGSEEVWLPILASTMTHIVIFLPIIFINKEIRLVYQGLAFTVTVSLLLSLLVALALVPMLASRLRLDREKVAPLSRLRESRPYLIYDRVFSFLMRHRYPFLGIVLILFLTSVWGLRHRDIDLPNTLEENEFGVIIFPIAGAELGANDKVAKKVEELLGKFPEVETISTVVRKDDLKIYVKLIPKKKRRHSKPEIMNYIREKGAEAIKEVHEDYSLIVDEGVSSDESKKFVINIFGLENDKLEELAHEAAMRISKIPAITNIVMTDLRKRPQYDLYVDKGRAAFYELTVKEVADSVHAQVRGMRPTKYHEIKKGEEIETITRLQAVFRQKIEDLRKIFVMNKKKDQILIEQIAGFYPSFGPNTIDRKDKYRYVFVKSDTSIPLETAGRRIREALKGMQFPADYFYRFGGKYPDLIKSKGQLTYAIFVTLLLVYMVLACLFQSYLQPLLIMLAVPLASIGVFLSLWVSGKPLSEPVFIGMIMLSGIVVNNSIILIDRINKLKESNASLLNILKMAGDDRLRPILMTASSTIIGFTPLAIGWGQSSDLWSPLAIIVIGGLLSSTVLTLIVIPIFYVVLEDIKKIYAKIYKRIESKSYIFSKFASVFSKG